MKKYIKKTISNILLYYHAYRYNKDLLSGCKVNGACKFNGNEVFGNNVHFNGIKIFGEGKVIFGDNFHSAEGLKMLTSFHNYKGDKIPYDHTLITKGITIEDNVWIGLNVIILGGVTIGEGAIIQAGAVVVKNIPPLGIAGGNPAQLFSRRDEKHYCNLKKFNKFQ